MCTKVISLQECSEARPGQLERVKFFPRMLLAVDDMITESEYHREKLKRHNRYLHGAGIVCGLEVTPAPSPAPTTAVQVGGGYALGPFGDEIFVGESVILDLKNCGPGAATDPCEPSILRGGNGVGATVIVAIKFAECLARPVRAMPAGCACEDDDCEYSRIRDSFQISCLEQLPSVPPIPPLCDFIHGNGLMTCPPVPSDPWVVLAQVTLPSGGIAMKIDSSLRRYIFATTIVQEQLIECCCNGKHVPPPPPPKTPATVVRIDPPNGAQFNTASVSVPPPPGQILIVFDKRLKPDTVNKSSIQVALTDVATGNSSIVDGNVSYRDSTKSAVFKPSSPFSGDPTGIRFDVTVRGEEPNAILDVDGLQLDGKKLGIPNNFTSNFTVITPIG